MFSKLLIYLKQKKILSKSDSPVTRVNKLSFLRSGLLRLLLLRVIAAHEIVDAECRIGRPVPNHSSLDDFSETSYGRLREIPLPQRLAVGLVVNVKLLLGTAVMTSPRILGGLEEYHALRDIVVRLVAVVLVGMLARHVAQCLRAVFHKFRL